MSTELSQSLHPEINGWGADLDHSQRPAYPMERTPPRLPNAPLGPPAVQHDTVEVLQSNERPAMPHLFGSPNPPSGLSGVLRRLAFKQSENDIRHWLGLLLADRVQVVEGLAADLAKGHLPNVFKEMGWRADWKYNRKASVAKIATTAAISGAIGYLLYTRVRKTRINQ